IIENIQSKQYPNLPRNLQIQPSHYTTILTQLNHHFQQIEQLEIKKSDIIQNIKSIEIDLMKINTNYETQLKCLRDYIIFDLIHD
ncbi:hypothetical protein BC833DRAFT_588266, partial [Globomyces pollinis-pini]